MLGTLARELGVRESQVRATVELLDGGATVPFIARYRKEATGGLDDAAAARRSTSGSRYLRELEQRRAAILESMREQGKLTPELEAQILAADTKARLEDIYLPYKPKRRTKAQIAREAGLEPLALGAARRPDASTRDAAAAAVRRRRRRASPTPRRRSKARGAILVERFAEDAELVGELRELLWERGRLVVAVVPGKEEEGAKFADYFDFAEPVTRLPSHRILAMFRGGKEGVLRLTLEAARRGRRDGPTRARAAASPAGSASRTRGRPADAWLLETVRWTWRTARCPPRARHRAEAARRRRGRGDPGVRRQPARPAARGARRAARRRWGSTPGSAPA